MCDLPPNVNPWLAFAPELVLLSGLLGLFLLSLGSKQMRAARHLSLATALLALGAALGTYGTSCTLFDGSYRVDLFSRLLQLVILLGYLCVAGISFRLPDIREEVKPEYFLFLGFHILGSLLLVSAVDMVAIVVALECSSFPLYILVAMRRERAGQRMQMESAIKYMMFGIAANGFMLFGFSYLYGLCGSTSLADIMAIFQGQVGGLPPLALVGLGMTLCGMLYKLAAFPFHFWTPDVYQGASNETATLVSTLPKIGAAALLVRFLSLVPLREESLSLLLGVMAAGSLFYGNLVALHQKDVKRLLGFSGIAHAGFILLGFVAQTKDGYTAALFNVYIYIFQLLACFLAICRLSPDGLNLSIADLAGLHRRSPLLAATFAVGIFGLAGIPPMAGFIGKFALLTVAWQQGFTLLVILAVINTAIAIYYYLQIIREVYFRDPEISEEKLLLDFPTRLLCLLLLVLSIGLGVFPGPLFETIATGLSW